MLDRGLQSTQTISERIRQAQRERHEGERWIGIAASREYRTARDIQIGHRMHAAMRVHHPMTRIGGHSRAAHVMRTSDDPPLPTLRWTDYPPHRALTKVAIEHLHPAGDGGQIDRLHSPIEASLRYAERIASRRKQYPVLRVRRLLRAKI